MMIVFLIQTNWPIAALNLLDFFSSSSSSFLLQLSEVIFFFLDHVVWPVAYTMLGWLRPLVL